MSIESSPNPQDTRDLARDIAVNGADVSEETLQSALEEVRVCKRAAGDKAEREQWADAEQAILGALSRKRREISLSRSCNIEVAAA